MKWRHDNDMHFEAWNFSLQLMTVSTDVNHNSRSKTWDRDNFISLPTKIIIVLPIFLSSRRRLSSYFLVNLLRLNDLSLSNDALTDTRSQFHRLINIILILLIIFTFSQANTQSKAHCTRCVPIMTFRRRHNDTFSLQKREKTSKQRNEWSKFYIWSIWHSKFSTSFFDSFDITSFSSRFPRFFFDFIYLRLLIFVRRLFP